MESKLPEPVDLAVDLEFFKLLTGSFHRLVGKALVQPGRGPAGSIVKRLCRSGPQCGS